MPIQIIDLFAGPGGLGEGFSSFRNGEAFRIAVSAEMESSAHSTLRLRSFFRRIRNDARAIREYYDFCHSSSGRDFKQNPLTASAWEESEWEAQQLTLGVDSHNAKLDQLIDHRLDRKKDWVLIGGPPCQAYSLVGRARNRGTAGYRAEDDHRHFLYKEYLRIIQRRRPAVFVMENVKGILSSKVGEVGIFEEILRDLSDPDTAMGDATSGVGYRIHSLVTDTFFEKGMDPHSIDPRDFVVRAEKYGLPQARHRVILVGIRCDIDSKNFRPLRPQAPFTVEEAIGDLPKLRSRLSRQEDDGSNWAKVVSKNLRTLGKDAANKKMKDLHQALLAVADEVSSDLPVGSLRHARSEGGNRLRSSLATALHDRNLDVWLNHEARSHMESDLCRYGFAATFAKLHGSSPKGHEQFSLVGLRPNHNNWESGKFADRFRVQLAHLPSTTITSHIAKDGHYFIHPDPSQCRSLTVREAARLQTFPDNYFFQGTRTQQFHQVGNAVPPMLAKQIAETVWRILK